MLIVLEGCDGVGKTTLASALVKQLQATRPTRVVPAGPPAGHPLAQYEETIASYRPGDTEHLVCDRLHLGEPIYGPRLRGEDRLGSEGLDHVNLLLQARGAVLVVVSARMPVVKLRLDDRGDDLVGGLSADDLTLLLGDYRRLAERSRGVLGTQCRQVDTSDWAIAAHSRFFGLSEIVAEAERCERWAARLGEFPDYVGPILPRRLLVGDEPNPNGAHPTTLPFAPYGNDSASYLLAAAAPLLSEGLGLTNSRGVDLRSLVNLVEPDEVVALGRNAEARLLDADVEPDRYVPHPQWWRRFRHHDLDEYTEELRG